MGLWIKATPCHLIGTPNVCGLKANVIIHRCFTGHAKQWSSQNQNSNNKRNDANTLVFRENEKLSGSSVSKKRGTKDSQQKRTHRQKMESLIHIVKNTPAQAKNIFAKKVVVINDHVKDSLTSMTQFLRKKDAAEEGEADVVWDGPLFISFGGSGFLSLFHVGAASRLQELGVINRDTKLYGNSGGALVAAAIACNVDRDDLVDFHLEAVRQCRKDGYWGRVGDVLRGLMRQHIPDDAVDLCNQRLGVGVMHIWPKRKYELVDHFYSKEDLIDALIASCYLPFFLGPRAFTKFRGNYVVDGCLGGQGKREGGVQIDPFSLSIKALLRQKDNDVSPRMLLEDYQVSPLKQVQWVFGHNMNEAHHRYLFEAGQKAADAWLERQNIDSNKINKQSRTFQ